MKGRKDTQWQKDLSKLSLENAVTKLRELGFQAILINRNGIPEKAKGLVQSLATMGYPSVIDSAAGDLVCVLLTRASPAGQEVRPEVR